MFSQHIIYVQAVLATLEDVFKCDSDNVFVDLPLTEMLNVNDGRMMNLAVTLNTVFGANLPLTQFSSQQSVNEIASVLECAKLECDMKVA